MSTIEWTDKTWNTVIGCTAHSGGCIHCYAAIMAARQAGMEGRPQYAGVVDKNRQWTGKINPAPDHIWQLPLKRKKPTVYFVNSMSDLFHENVLEEWIVRTFDIMNRCPHHHFQVLTKLPSRAVAATKRLGLKWSENIWIGASVAENKFAKPFVRELQKIPAAIRFISAEPLLEFLPDLDVAAVDWVIAGGESGNVKTIRAAHIDWFRDLRDRCKAAGTPFFFKQWGSHDENGDRQRNKHNAGNLLDGRQHFEMPDAVSAVTSKNWTVAKATSAPAPSPAPPHLPAPVMATSAIMSRQVAHRDAIFSLLLKSGPMSGAALRSAIGPSPNSSNIHEMAIIALQQDRKIIKRVDNRYYPIVRVNSNGVRP